MEAYRQNIAQRRAASDTAQGQPAADAGPVKQAGAASDGAATQGGLSDSERQVVVQLKARDAEVRAHEQAHQSVGGQYAGSASYTYQSGPDGRQYAIGGEVPINVAPVQGDPQATIDKMQVVKAAALAPAEPSSADRQIAALADAQRAQAMADLRALRTEEMRGGVDITA
jgi:hypothetical protein